VATRPSTIPALENTMNRTMMVALALLLAWGAGLVTARAGDTESHSPVASTHKGERASARLRHVGATPGEKSKSKQSANHARHQRRADRLGSSRQVGTVPTDSHKAKQSLNHSRHQHRADRVGSLRQVGTMPADSHKPKQSVNHSRNLHQADRAGAKYLHRGRGVEQRTTKADHSVRRASHRARVEPKHRSQLAARRYHTLSRGVKSSHTAAKKVPAGEKQTHRRKPSRKS
jgi:hypothetical protein